MIQLQYLNKVLSSGDKTLITLNDLSAEFFSDYKDEFNFIKSHIDTYGKVPDFATFIAKFPDFDVVQVNETDRYLIDALYEDRNKRALAKVFNNIRELLNNGNTEGALNLYNKSQEMFAKAKYLESVDIFKDLSRYDAYVERSQDFNKYYVKTGFKELDDIIGGWDRKEELATIVARTNVGKCLAKGTEVLMADGTLKKVEDVKVGDKVQSLNRVNTVLALHNGISNGYEIIPKVGNSFTISENHILTVATLKEKWDKNRKQTITDNEFEIKDVMIEDYLKWSNHKKHLSKLYYPKIDYPHKDLEIPPYILGLWLGDGTASNPTFTTMDDEIVQELHLFAQSMGLECHKLYHKGKAFTYSIVNNTYSKQNPFMTFLRKNDLLNNKHIPIDYLTGDYQQRLELLAGLLDTDGYISKNKRMFGITQKSFDIIKQIAQLCRGLGLKVGKFTTKFNKRYNKNYYSINISGNINMIPVKLPRKKPAVVQHKQSDFIVSGFRVKPIETVNYYGFECDGDKRYLLWNNILTHNTFVLLKVAVAAAQQGLKVGIYSGEMSENKVGYRIDTLLSHISNTKIIHGNTDIQVEYKKYLEDISNYIKGTIVVLTPNMAGGTVGVSKLRAFIEKENLDMLCVDQHSLLDDDRGARNPVERAANISKDLKNLQVMSQIPIITVSQQNRNSTENGIDNTMIAQSDRIGQDSTVILFFEKKDDVLTMYLTKARDSVNGKTLKYAVDFDKGVFTYIPIESDATQGKSCEELRNEFETESGEEPF